jgi:hypothetical protein
MGHSSSSCQMVPRTRVALAFHALWIFEIGGAWDVIQVLTLARGPRTPLKAFPLSFVLA